MSKIADEIAALKKQLAELEEQERAEKEETRKKANLDIEKELTALKNAVKAFNVKHDDNITLKRTVIHKYRDLFSDSEVIIEQEV